MGAVDEYIERVIGVGDEGSERLAGIAAQTLRNSKLVDIISEGKGGIAVLRVPAGKRVLVHSATGNPEEMDTASHAESFVERLVSQARIVGAQPVAFANIIDASTGDPKMIAEIGQALSERANHHGLAMMGGELAILGERVNCPANLSGTMISLVGSTSHVFNSRSFENYDTVNFKGSVFDPKGKAVYINSDGIGTKTEFYERMGIIHPSGFDFAAMNLDDSIKLGALARVLSGIGEMSQNDSSSRGEIYEMERVLANTFGKLGLDVTITAKFAGDRIRSYKEGVPAFNVSGSVVSVIDEAFLANPLVPSSGQYLVAIAGIPNPRSNGITDKRKLMERLLGVEWHTTEIGKSFLSYLATSSTTLYPVFRKLVDDNLATSVYHMSGGAYNSKLARPLAKQGLFAAVDSGKLFRPDWRELAIQDLSSVRTEDAYQKWPMGNDGSFTTSDPERAVEVLQEYGLRGKVVAQLENGVDGRTGVQLVGLKASSGKDVYYSGK